MTGPASSIMAPYKGGAERALSSGETTVTKLVEEHLDRISRFDHAVSAFICVMADEALGQAEELDKLDPAARGPLHGMILSIKDIIDVEGVPTTCGSRSRLDRTAPADAHLVARLRTAGAVFIGKANCHEFAFGGPAFDLPFPPARNPWNSELFPGGSSSGSGVSVAAGFCHASIGTDTAGSIRLPSSHCGTVGLKTSRNAVALEGVRALSPSLDSVGPMARSVADCAAIHDVLSGNGLATGLVEPGRLSLAVPEPSWLDMLECQRDVIDVFETACSAFEDAGVSLQAVSLPPLRDIHAASAVVMMREVAEIYAAEVRGDYEIFGEMFRNRALLGERISDRHYRLALAHCERHARKVSASLDGCLALLLPAYPTGPSQLGAVDKFYFLQRPNLNAIANCTGMPTLSLPVLRDSTRRPLGIQLMAERDNESGLLAAGRVLEELLAYPHQNPFAEGHNGC